MKDRDNKKLKDHYNNVYAQGSENYYTFSSYEESYVILDYLKELNGKKVLEIGCGEGGLASMITHAGGVVTAVDYSNEVIKIAKTKYNLQDLEFICDDYKNISNKFDVIVLQGTLEHFDEPWEDLNWITDNLLEENGYIVNSSPSFINPRGYVWMTLQLLFDIPMSLSDLHFLCPFDFEEYCKNKNCDLEYTSSNQSWGNGQGMIIDFNKRLRNALRDANMTNENVDKLLDWLNKAKEFSTEASYTGANVIYRIQPRS
tara:strand:- start:22 stop:795 length:774 start_codon:yes stop_codon:yes gene_type:complete